MVKYVESKEPCPWCNQIIQGNRVAKGRITTFWNIEGKIYHVICGSKYLKSKRRTVKITIHQKGYSKEEFYPLFEMYGKNNVNIIEEK